MKDLLIEIVMLIFLIAFAGGIPFYLSYWFKKKDKEREQEKVHKI